MAESAQVAKVSHRHEAIIQFLVENPGMSKGDVAKHFGYTQAWLSTLIHSDAFRAQLKERQDEFFSMTAAPIAEKLQALASDGIDQLHEKLENRLLETAEISDLVKMSLDRLGYGKDNSPAPAGGQTNISVYAVSPEVIQRSREKIISRGEIVDDSGVPALPAPEEV